MKKYRSLFYPHVKKKLITIIIPCKDREDLTRQCFEAIQNKTYDLSCIQVVAVIDLETVKDQQLLSDIYNSLNKPFPLICIARPSSAHLNRDYYNLANTVSSSFFTWVIGNDVIIETQDWDKILLDKTNDILPSIDNDDDYYYIHINDDTHVKGRDYISPEASSAAHLVMGNCFPIISNNYSYKVRGPMPEQCYGWGADVRLYERIKECGFQEIDLCTDIYVSHISAHTNKGKQDHIFDMMKTRCDLGELETSDSPDFTSILNTKSILDIVRQK
jgi:cellulose synthase/poly-beta-1,6-N-acetylglucosamine synthase-like glycosyltransferase